MQGTSSFYVFADVKTRNQLKIGPRPYCFYRIISIWTTLPKQHNKGKITPQMHMCFIFAYIQFFLRNCVFKQGFKVLVYIFSNKRNSKHQIEWNSYICAILWTSKNADALLQQMHEGFSTGTCLFVNVLLPSKACFGKITARRVIRRFEEKE